MHIETHPSDRSNARIKRVSATRRLQRLPDPQNLDLVEEVRKIVSQPCRRRRPRRPGKENPRLSGANLPEQAAPSSPSQHLEGRLEAGGE